MATIYWLLRSLSPSLVALTLFTFISGFSTRATAQGNETPPNILLVIADDLGVDASNGYHQGGLMPTTPTLDSLRSVGITFENVFAAPVCTPTRAAIMSAKYGVNTGVTGVPGNLDFSHTSIFTALADQTNNLYADAVIGKWHLSSPADPLHPAQHGADYHMGVIGGAVGDYYAWNKTENGTTSQETTYVTTAFTDAAIDWVNEQEDQHWFLWFAHVAPHSPLHVPPSHMYSVPTTGNNFRKYVAMIESVDYELNRLLYAMPDSVRENTLIIYMGDNGTPNNVLRDYPSGHGKGSLYQGGIRVPMIIAGAGVSRQGERESALIHVSDIHATLLEVAGAELPGGLYNSLSFHHLLTNAPGPTRDYNYSEGQNNGLSGFTIRGPQYKLIEYMDGSQEFYDLLNDSLEVSDLLANTLTEEQLVIKADLEAEAEQIRTAWSCRDHIQNGDEEEVDCGGSYCAPCVTATEDDPMAESGLRVFPNPSSDVFRITSEHQPIQQITLRTISGQIVKQLTAVNSMEVSLNVAHLSPQILLLEVTNATGVQTRKVVKTP